MSQGGGFERLEQLRATGALGDLQSLSPERLSPDARILAHAFEETLSRLHDSARREEALRRSLGRLLEQFEDHLRAASVLQRVMDGLVGRYDLGEICTRAARIMQEELGLGYCSILLRDEEGRLIRRARIVRASHDPDAEPRAAACEGLLKLAPGLMAETYRENRPFHVHDVASDARFAELETAPPLRSLLGLPLNSENQPLGVLVMGHPGTSFFHEGRRQVLTILAPVVSHLVSFSQLLERLSRLNENLEEDIRQRVAEARESQLQLGRREKLAALGETISGIAHELNNRLVPIVCYAEVLENERLDEENARRVKSISDCAAGVKSIVESLLGFSRQRKPREAPTDLNALVMRVLSVLRLALQHEGVLVSFRPAEDLPHVMADGLQIEQVLLNLIRNAQDAIRVAPQTTGGVIDVSTERQGESALVYVRDNGCGIPTEHLNKIMDPFFTTKKLGEGTGLGLSVCYGIMSEHGGDIQVRSQLGDTEITLRFPVLEASGAPDELPATPSSAEIPAYAAAEQGRLRVLVVDDEEPILELLKEILEATYTVEAVSSAYEALRLLEANRYDAIVSDMRMPGLGGQDIYRWLKDNRPGEEKRLIFTTGDTFDPNTKEFLDGAGNVCLSKPFTVAGLKKAVARLCGSCQAQSRREPEPVGAP